MDLDLNRRFGVEIECFNLTRAELCDALVTAWGHDAPDAVRGPWQIDRERGRATDPLGRLWCGVSDGSIESRGAESVGELEIVTPPLTLQDIPYLQRIIRVTRDAGAKVNGSCGVHVHIDASDLDAPTVGKIAKLTARTQRLLIPLCGVQTRRLESYCKPLDADRAARLGRAKDSDALARAWYGSRAATRSWAAGQSKYHGSRYCGVNLHRYLSAAPAERTVEFRWFEGFSDAAKAPRDAAGTVHAGRVRAYILLALATVARAQALKSVRASGLTPTGANGSLCAYDGRAFERVLGIEDDPRFGIVRDLLLADLPGLRAFRGGVYPAAWLAKHRPGMVPPVDAAPDATPAPASAEGGVL